MENNDINFIEKYFHETADSVLNIDSADNPIVKKIIVDTKHMMKEVCKANAITYSQLRNVYQLVKEDGMTFKDIQLVRPKIAYVQARLEKKDGQKFLEMIDDFIDRIDSDEAKATQQIKNFQAFMQSIVAYHKLNS
jgi:CRISPR type III-A-associated protein Csm2